MKVGIITIGNELLSGDIENSNATWLAARLDESGVQTKEITVIPDETSPISSTVRDFSTRFNAVVVTGGLGSTPDDVTLDGVAAAFDVTTEPDEDAREEIMAAIAAIRKDHSTFEFDIDAAVRYPAQGALIPNAEGIAPGWIIENVYVIPGIPSEMKAMFERISHEFSGKRQSRTFHSTISESHLNGLLNEVRERFEVAVGCYPADGVKRIKLSSTEADRLERATEWMEGRSEIDTDL